MDNASSPDSPVQLSEGQGAIHIASSSAESGFWCIAGVLFLIMFPLGVSGILGGQYGLGIAIASIPLAVIGMAIWIGRGTLPVFATLYSDRIEVSDFGYTFVANWDNVETICWSTAQKTTLTVQLRVRDRKDTKSRFLYLNLDHAQYDERAKLIAYVHMAGKEAEQSGWSEFCRRHALPLIGVGEEKQQTAQGEIPTLSSIEKLLIAAFVLGRQHPFIAGLLFPVWFPFVPVLVVSRELCWLVAGAVLVSSFVNIRLVWGEWLFPFSEGFLTVAAGFFILGFLASPSPKSDDEPGVKSSYAGIFLFIGLVGAPLAGNAMIFEWVPIRVASWLIIAMLLCLFFPVYLAMRNRHRQAKQKEAPGPDSLQSWANFELGTWRHIEQLES
jgi:hypothetical protein